MDEKHPSIDEITKTIVPLVGKCDELIEKHINHLTLSIDQKNTLSLSIRISLMSEWIIKNKPVSQYDDAINSISDSIMESVRIYIEEMIDNHDDLRR